MANTIKYKFKVYLQNGETKMLVPKEIQNADLPDLDRFSIEKKGYINLCRVLGEELSISPHQIQKITILQIQTGIEFSLVLYNQYLSSILSSLQTKKILGHGNYWMNTTVISSNHDSYLEMKKYLLENIHTNYSHFLKEIYYYPNQFHNLLYQYGVSYHQGIYGEEEARNMKELEQRIALELSIYKNYRSLCIARKRWEENRKYQNQKNQNHIQNVSVTNYANQNSYTMNRIPENDLGSVTILFNQQNEEFLEPEEYEEMLGEDSSNSKYRY